MPNFLGALDWGVDSVGDVGDAGDYIGARRRRRGGGHAIVRGYGQSAAMNRYTAAQHRANMAASFVSPDVPGTPGRDAALLPAAFPTVAFAAADGLSSKLVNMNPQNNFRGQRLTAVVIRNGTSAAVAAPQINTLQVGMKPIITTANPVPLEVFNQNAFDTNLLFPPTTPGVLYQMSLSLTAALANTDTITCLTAVIGSALL